MTDKKKPTYEGKLHVDLPFEEAMERFVGVDPKEVAANIDRAKQKKAGTTQAPAVDVKSKGESRPDRKRKPGRTTDRKN